MASARPSGRRLPIAIAASDWLMQRCRLCPVSAVGGDPAPLAAGGSGAAGLPSAAIGTAGVGWPFVGLALYPASSVPVPFAAQGAVRALRQPMSPSSRGAVAERGEALGKGHVWDRGKEAAEGAGPGACGRRSWAGLSQGAPPGDELLAEAGFCLLPGEVEVRCLR